MYVNEAEILHGKSNLTQTITLKFLFALIHHVKKYITEKNMLIHLIFVLAMP